MLIWTQWNVLGCRSSASKLAWIDNVCISEHARLIPPSPVDLLIWVYTSCNAWMEKGNIKVSSLLLMANTLAYIITTKNYVSYGTKTRLTLCI